jgi:hypothetical protein
MKAQRFLINGLRQLLASDVEAGTTWRFQQLWQRDSNGAFKEFLP